LKNKVLVIMLIIFLIYFNPINLVSADLTYKVFEKIVDFDLPKIREFNEYQFIEMSGCGAITMPGHPALPMKTVMLKFDLDDVIMEVEVDVSTWELEGVYHIAPTPKPIYDDDYELTEPDPSIYGSDEPYPGRWFDYEIKLGLDPSTMKRVRYLILHLYPIQYIPRMGKLIFCDEMKISVRYRSERRMSSNEAQAEDYELLIITSPALKSYAIKLMHYKRSIGISTLVKTTEEIYAEFDGRDYPERILSG